MKKYEVVAAVLQAPSSATLTFPEKAPIEVVTVTVQGVFVDDLSVEVEVTLALSSPMAVTLAEMLNRKALTVPSPADQQKVAGTLPDESNQQGEPV